jgi:hypothetical protein
MFPSQEYGGKYFKTLRGKQWDREWGLLSNSASLFWREHDIFKGLPHEPEHEGLLFYRNLKYLVEIMDNKQVVFQFLFTEFLL